VARGQSQQSRLLREAVIGAVTLFICVTALACGRDELLPLPVQSAPQPARPAASGSQQEGRSPAAYQSKGRRDPFRPSRTAIAEQSPTVYLTVTGIIREAHSFYALVESDASPGMGYIIRENDVVDSSKVAKITKNSVVFEVHTKGPDGKLLTRYVEKHLPPVVSR